MERTQPHESEANFSIEEYGAKTAEKEECEEQLLTEYATLLGFYLASVAVVTGIAVQQNRLPRKFGLLDLALLGIATHKLSRIVAKDRITGILRAPFVSYIRSAGAGEVEEEPRGRGFQRGIGHLFSCPYCMAPWCATARSWSTSLGRRPNEIGAQALLRAPPGPAATAGLDQRRIVSQAIAPRRRTSCEATCASSVWLSRSAFRCAGAHGAP